jgi:hypothetical protein
MMVIAQPFWSLGLKCASRDTWVIRYVVVDASTWLTSRKVLITPISIHHPNWGDRTLPVSISKEQVRNSPNIDTNEPVSRQNEMQYLRYYGYPNYWGGEMYPYGMDPGYTGYGVDIVSHDRDLKAYLRSERDRHCNDNPHLRSCNNVIRYHLHANDGEVGHVVGYLLDDKTWAIRYLIIDTSNWWMGHQVLVAPAWITGVHWPNQTVSVDLSRKSFKNAPPYHSDVDWTRDMELNLFRHYGRSEYWANSLVPKAEI